MSLSARVRLDGPSQDTLAGLVARRQGTAVGEYLVAVRGKNSGALCGIYEKTGAGQPGTWTLRLNGGAACKLPLNEWHVVGMRVYNTTIPATARIDMLVDGTVAGSSEYGRGTTE